jgi:hypothetical protein
MKNSTKDVSDERAIDAFIEGLRRQDLVEEIGRIAPKNIGTLMDTANRWANGEDAVNTKRNRSPGEEPPRYNSNPQRRRYREYEGSRQVSAGFRGNSDQRDDYHKNSGYKGEKRDATGSSRTEYRPRPPREYFSPEDTLNGPCQMHFFVDPQGKRQSNHLMKDCLTFINLQRAANASQTEAVNRGYARQVKSEVHVPLPPAPAIAGPTQQLQLEAVKDKSNGYTEPKGSIIMIQKARPSNRTQKLITRQVNMATQTPPPAKEYLNWSDQPIGFDQSDHPPQVPRPGHAAMVLPAVIAGFDVSRVFVDGGSSLNLIYANTLRKMNISLANLRPSDTRFHGVTPEKPNFPLGEYLWICNSEHQTISGRKK